MYISVYLVMTADRNIKKKKKKKKKKKNMYTSRQLDLNIVNTKQINDRYTQKKNIEI